MMLNLQIAPIDDLTEDLAFSCLTECGLNIKFTTVPIKDKKFLHLATDEPCNKCKGDPKVCIKCRQCGGTGKFKVVTAARIRYDSKIVNHISALLDFLHANKSILDGRLHTSIEVKESGGLSNGVGKACIVCGTHGEKLKCAVSFSNINGVHAIFYVNIALLIHDRFENKKHSGLVSLVAVEKATAHRKYRLSHIYKPLYEYVCYNHGAIDYKDVAKTKIEFPEEAVRAAMKKSEMQDCNSVVYAYT